jgi:hypothetical protein
MVLSRLTGVYLATIAADVGDPGKFANVGRGLGGIILFVIVVVIISELLGNGDR